MLAARMYGPNDIRVEETAKPIINDNEILLKVKSAAICGTDIRMYLNGYPGIDEKHPHILGHEFSGIIEQVGENISEYKKGMRVAVAPNMGCGVCDLCVSGNTHLCKDYKAPGINLDGGFAEYVKIPEAAVRQGNICVIDEHVSFEAAALNEPLSCVYNAFIKADIGPGDYVLIIGAGPIGLMHAKLAKMAGASKVMINDISEQRLAESQEVDPSFISILSDGLKEQISKKTNGKGLDVCITACPAPAAQQIALELTGMNGRIIFFGGLPKNRQGVELNTNHIHYKQLVITGTTRASVSQFRKTLSFIADGILEVDSLISAKFSLAEIHQALGKAKDAIGLKNVINFK